MEATKNITAKEREFIAAVEAHRNAEGKVIAWNICANGNGKVIFENATKDRYSCAYVIDMEGGYFLLFVGERAGHPYDRKTYKRKGNALKGFKMQEGHNEPPTFAATPTETPQISTQTAETVNVSAEGEKEAERANVKDMKHHYDAVAPAHYKHTLYKFNEYLYAFGKDAELLKEFFSNNRWIELKWVEHNLNGASYLRFHYSHMDDIKDFLKKKLNLDNILIGVWDSEEVWYWSKQNSPSQPPQPPETPQTAECTAEQPEPRETAEIKITSITQLNVLKYKLQHPKLKEWAVKYGLLDLVRKMYYAPELSLGGLWIDNKFRQSLCENDKAIIAAVRKVIADAEKAA